MLTQPSAIFYDPPLIRFCIDGRIAAERPLAALRRVIEVDYGSAFYSNEGQFDLIDFGDALWVIPEDIGLPTHKAGPNISSVTAATSERRSSGHRNAG